MVHTKIDSSYIKNPYQDVKKGKDDRTIPAPRMSQQQQQPRQFTTTKSSEKYGAWGPVYKNKENFVDMHIC